MARYIWDKNLRKWVDRQDYFAVAEPVAPMIMRDIDPYQSIVTGETISSRSTHRDHLRSHGLVEVGNESVASSGKRPAPPPAGRDVKQAIDALKNGHRVPDFGHIDSPNTRIY